MICPNCDHRLTPTGCGSCGWKLGDVVTRNPKVFPYLIGGEYPEHTSAPAPFANRPDTPDIPMEEIQSRTEK